SALLRPPHRHPEAPDIAVGGQRAVRVQDDDRKRNDAARDDAHELHVLGHHADTVEPQIAFATILGHGTHPPWWSPRLARMARAEGEEAQGLRRRPEPSGKNSSTSTQAGRSLPEPTACTRRRLTARAAR